METAKNNARESVNLWHFVESRRVKFVNLYFRADEYYGSLSESANYTISHLLLPTPTTLAPNANFHRL